MTKLELRKQLKVLYSPSAKKVELVSVQRLQFAMVDGTIEKGQTPSTSAQFSEAVNALYGISYTLKFTAKLRRTRPVDYPVMPLEALWWVEGGEFDITRPDNWHFTAMILQPDLITAALFRQGIGELRRKRGDSPALAKLRLGKFAEGLCMQTMHVGPYATETATIERMKAFAAQNGLRPRGKHHEIYLGDPRRAKPEKLKTILRQAVSKGGQRTRGA